MGGELRLLERLLISGALALSSADTPPEHAASDVPQHDWILRNGKSWQCASTVAEDTETTDEREGNRGNCPSGMVEVRGKMKTEPSAEYLDALQKLTCSRWLNEEFPERCAEYDASRWSAVIAKMPDKEVSFCIDRFEYPNIAGQYPWIFVTFTEAVDLCAEAGKRLCSEDEWTFACEGEEALPYPYGFRRSSEACVIDRPWRDYDEHQFADRTSRAAMLELDGAWQGEPAGSRPQCKSPFGVYDMTGNVDEWTRSTSSRGYASILKGGYWGQVRARCRASTRAHGENFAFYQQGFRCCADCP
jgi:hypothetical protein